MEEEVWKDIVGYEGSYEVSNLGRVKSIRRVVKRLKGNLKIRECLLKTASRDGYPFCRLSKSGTKKNAAVHCLVAFAFLEYPITSVERIVTDHINGIKTDNRSVNLRFVTHRFNVSEGFRKDIDRVTSKYMGVHFDKRNKIWRAGIRINRKAINLGSFENEIDAHNAYQNERLKLNI